MFLLVNFGGPRDLGEIPIFLRTLLTDPDVIRPTSFLPLHNLLFSLIARKRAKTAIKEYEEIGGKSPIYEETETLARLLEEKMGAPFITFHRYLPETHKKTLSLIENAACSEIIVLPLFPQFSYATTGSAARFFSRHLTTKSLNKLHWVKSYSSHPDFIRLWQNLLTTSLEKAEVNAEDALFLFSAHGLPQSFIDEGDPYVAECELTVSEVMRAFPQTMYRLGYQSQFGKERWNEPYTKTLCETISKWNGDKKELFFIPISFISEHFETLFEIDKIYIPQIRASRLNTHRLPSCFSHPEFPAVLASILHDFSPSLTQELIRI